MLAAPAQRSSNSARGASALLNFLPGSFAPAIRILPLNGRPALAILQLIPSWKCKTSRKSILSRLPRETTKRSRPVTGSRERPGGLLPGRFALADPAVHFARTVVPDSNAVIYDLRFHLTSQPSIRYANRGKVLCFGRLRGRSPKKCFARRRPRKDAQQWNKP